jgi:hypothetical protein
MKKIQLICSATLISVLGLGLATLDYPAASGRFGQSARGSNRSTGSSHTPVHNTFRMLKAAAKSLTYFPNMERAIAASPVNPEHQRAFQAAEVKLTGVGPVRIGMTLEEATDALGIPLIPLGSNLSGECSYYQPETSVQFLGLMVVDNRVIRIDIWPGSTLATVSGATIGSTEAELLEKYPGQIEAAPNPYTQGKFLVFVPEDPEFSLYRLVFETDARGQVVQYRTGQFPAVTWPDGCI